MNAKRFRDLIQVVEETPESEFDFTRWWGCAIGHYIRKFPNRGMKIVPWFNDVALANRNGYVEDRDDGLLASHFDITDKAARDLFIFNTEKMTREKMLTQLRELYEKETGRACPAHAEIYLRKSR